MAGRARTTPCAPRSWEPIAARHAIIPLQVARSGGGLQRLRSRPRFDPERRGDFQAAASLYKKVLSADPQHAIACDRLAALYLAQGKRDKASAQYAELVRIAPQTLNQFDIVLATLKKLQPAFAVGLLAHS